HSGRISAGRKLRNALMKNLSDWGNPAYFLSMPETLVINEIYLSLQGESTFAGLPCIFVRLTACNLRCSYCDTAYAFAEGKKQSLLEVRAEVNRLADPFLQKLPVTAREPISALHSP